MERIEQAWNNITLESAEFILEQAEKKMQATIDTANSLTDRAVNVMQFSIPLSLALIGLIVTDPRKEFLWLYLVVLTLSIIISYMTLYIYDMYSVRSPGYRPGFLLNEKILKLNQEEQYVGLLFETIEITEKQIEANEELNHKRQYIMFLVMTLMKFTIGFTCVYLAIAVPMFLFQIFPV